jgi:homoserine kinase
MIKVCVPATSANCCVGFDSLGLAVNWMAEFTFEKNDVLCIDGCPAEYCDENNLVVTSFAHVCRKKGLEMVPFKLHIDSTIPFARGLGSSSTCVVAGVMAANAWFDLKMDKMELLELATELEGHPDNVAPAIFGQATCCLSEEHLYMETIDMADWHLLAFIPNYPISTHEARKLLPSTLSFKDAVHQTAAALTFVQALSKGDQHIAAAAAKDLLHEPYRSKLIAEYEPLKKKAQELDFPMWISGSGSTMMAAAKNREVLNELKDYAARHFHLLEQVELEVQKEGAQVIHV